MGFPYLAPLKKWTKDVLEDRERSPNFGNLKMPFVVMSSTATVLKSSPTDTTKTRKEKLTELYNGDSSQLGSGYYGCIISNFLHRKDNYSTGKTLVGYDFNGTPIRVESETNRRISPPIIESIEIDTDGANNTLKTARVSVKCFSLKQLELFEMFFLKPGLHIVVEFGDGSLLRQVKNKTPNQSNSTGNYLDQNLKTGGKLDRTTLDSIESELFVNKSKDYTEFIKLAVEQSLSKPESIERYIASAERTLGTYDYVSGRVTEFSYSVEDNGVYSISLEICQSNQFTLAIPHNFNKESSKASVPITSANLYEQASTQLKSDLNIDNINISGSANWQNEFFNWGALNLKQKDELASLKHYISFRFILKVLANYTVGSISEFTIAPEIHKVNGKDIEYIPVRSHPDIISSSESIIFPGNLPSITGSSATNEIVINNKQRENFKINGYSFNESSKDAVIVNINNPSKQKIEVDNGYVVANALNCFILYDEVVKIWRNSFTRLDFIESILALINENSYGLFELRVGSSTETSKATIIDVKMGKAKIESTSTVPIYRFKPTTVNSIVRNFTFNMEMSNLIAGRTVFNAQNFIKQAIETNKKDTKQFKEDLQEKTIKSIDMSQFGSYDGYYTINQVDLIAAKAREQEFIKQVENGVVKGDPNEDTSTTSAVDLSALIKNKSIAFKLDNKSEKLAILIFTDKAVIHDGIYKQLEKDKQPIKSILTPIEVTVTIDGMSGFSCGEYFHIDGVSETYNRDGVFQITNIKHSVTDIEWTTTLEAGWRIVN